MKKFLILIFIFFELAIQCQTKKVLFIGNSYTYTNDMPGLVAQIAISTGNTLIYDSNAQSGWTLEQHWNDSTTRQQIREGYWDYVVLQEYSQNPSYPDSFQEVYVYPYVNFLNNYIK